MVDGIHYTACISTGAPWAFVEEGEYLYDRMGANIDFGEHMTCFVRRPPVIVEISAPLSHISNMVCERHECTCAIVVLHLHILCHQSVHMYEQSKHVVHTAHKHVHEH